MNRKKKINQTLKSKLKKMNAKLQNSNKPKYVSKAERAAIAANEAETNVAEGSDVSSNEATLDNSADSLADNSAENNVNNDAKNDAK
ncbi:DUF2986 domain-containing protein [Colwellia sp. 6M3]|jgi:hypothetical protein|uniref:DUF2986 domain-containing protein n=1 Tax=Colwellia sp. 6M3 TaxID=2759849 RepID=UPI0015F35B0E|nr:DUF2986 domain-containing protein [Colwellia sp. 6M3]MBA6416228.1 DUF2986 domain-containing protein [Colwellia sp. 6M3]|tara:strand:+ start:2054 stop:2314 length:261 start_codon:yes stop_codon:yes gene_type:complete